MGSFLVKPAARVNGKLVFLGDKSIAHRCLIVSVLSRGKTIIENFPANKDCLYTLKAFKKLGIKITRRAKKHKSFLTLAVSGKGLYGLKRPQGPIFVGASGTTLRLLLGVLAAQNFEVKLLADESLSERPMLRVTAPLRMMGAQISARTKKTRSGKIEEYPPITIRGGCLKPVSYRMPVASAQVKSAILLAGLYAKGVTEVNEPQNTRDHSERILKLFKADIKVKLNKILIKGERELISPGRIYVPGDISSASFFIVLASILPDSEILIKNISLNPSRAGVIKALRRMGADIQERAVSSAAEPIGDLLVKSSPLKGIIVKRGQIPSLIDEIPILMVAACFASGRTIFEGVGELRVKETDRINSMSGNLRKMGADIKVSGSGSSEKIVIAGVKHLIGARVAGFGDHRTAMSMVIAGMGATGKTYIDDAACIKKSFPNFLSLIDTVRQ